MASLQKKSHFRVRYLTLGLLLVLGACTQKPQSNPNELRILTYSSLVGKNSVGEALSEEFKKHCPECVLNFQDSEGNAGLLSALSSLHKRKRLQDFDLVIGLNEIEYALAKQEGLVKEGIAFDQSPMSLIVDTKSLPANQWPKTWKELHKNFRGKVLTQDPRLSSPGLSWLRIATQKKLLSLEELKSLSAHVFPNWSGAYDAFLSGKAPMVWSYLGSEAYHLCNDKEPLRYRALPLAEGYPIEREFAAELSQSTKGPLVKKLLTVLGDTSIQKMIPTRNWMFPASADAPLPDCFKQTTTVTTFELPLPTSSQTLIEWKDLWSQ